MNTTTHPFQPLSAAPPWHRPEARTLDVPPAKEPRRALAATARRAWRHASQRLHEVAPPPRTMHESLGLRRPRW